MRISLFLNTTMSKSCVHPQKQNWVHQGKRAGCFPHDNKRSYLYEAASSSKQSNSLHSRSTNHIKQLPDFLNACYELQCLINSRTTLTQALDAAVKQIYSLSALLLLCLTLVLLSAQVAGVLILLSCAVTLPLGFQFMVAAVFIISATAFKIMH